MAWNARQRGRNTLKSPYLPLLVSWLVILVALGMVAKHYSLYWIFPHLDKAMHFIGGITIGLFACVVLGGHPLRPGTGFAVVLALLLLIGGGYELYEYLFNNVIRHVPFDRLDTATDLLSDILGGLITFAYMAYLDPLH